MEVACLVSDEAGVHAGSGFHSLCQFGLFLSGWGTDRQRGDQRLRAHLGRLHRGRDLGRSQVFSGEPRCGAGLRRGDGIVLQMFRACIRWVSV